MKLKTLILTLLTFVTIESYSQIDFEKGYFIDESNQRTECLIKNVDWYYNPTGFDYKLTPDGPVEEADIQSVKEFGIGDLTRYVRADVKIDYSGNSINELSTNKNPEFKQELLFLKVLIDGEASLFLYNGTNITRFFYKMKDSDINQLIYKQYLVDDGYAHNYTFRQQLYADMKCKTMEERDFTAIKYVENDLKRVFTKFNSCTNSDYISFYETKQLKDFFNLSLRPGVTMGKLSMENSESSLKNTDFGNSLSFRLGAEAEFLLSSNKNKWGIIAEPTYRYYKAEQTSESSLSGGVLISKVDYKSIELPVGVRHYFYLNDQSKLFANIVYVFDFAFNSSLKNTRNDGSIASTLELKSRGNFAFGAGYKYQDRYSIEIRYNTNRDTMSNYVVWNSEYSSLNVIFGISLFN